ncbi:Imm49 family immunity protein [Chondromyces apiculatus]|uniref:Imm49 family immunity protein n=1 Tax=Chondromyces apiculatus TaxID=51 RepID=UPI0018CC2BBC|nr:Imm49 family immunity protein [Chondromyces apiculatus]
MHEELVSELHYGMLSVGKAPISAMGDEFDAFSHQFEALGICHLLEFADESEFLTNLIRSGHARRYFLRRSRAEGNVADRHLALSRTNSFLAAAAAGDGVLARQIADESTETWNPAWEYEDDHHFFLLLHRLVQQGPSFPSGDVPAILTAFERSLDGATSARHAVCHALVAGDASAFLGALSELMQGEAALRDEKRSSAAVHEGDVAYWPHSFVSVEGLALLNLAQLRGISTETGTTLPLCPEIARLPWSTASVEDLFEAMARLP